MDCSLPGSSVPGILQARILEWVAISSSRGSSSLRDRICVSCIGMQVLYQLHQLGSHEKIKLEKKGPKMWGKKSLNEREYIKANSF